MTEKKATKKAKKKKVPAWPAWLVLGHSRQEARRVADGITEEGVILVVCTLADLEEGERYDRVIDPHRVLQRASTEDRRRAMAILGDVDVT